MIQISNLRKNYNNQTVLKDINLHIKKGTIHGLLGSSGAGKSTLLKCMNALEGYDSGSLKVDDVEVKSLNGKSLLNFRKKIGMIFQDFALLERKSALENVLLPLECWGYKKDTAQKRALELLSLVGISEKASFRPRELSGGQKQRVAIARTLALNPSILLCDEATSALDPITTTSILELLKDINKKLNITIVIVTHELSVVKQICDNLSIVKDGEIILDDSVENILKTEPKEFLDLAGYPKLELKQNEECFKISFDKNNSSLLFDLSSSLKVAYSVIFAQTEQSKIASTNHIYIGIDEKDKKKVEEFLHVKSYNFKLINKEEISYVF
ncbi:MAG: methionine ABC transporter ATP-binding protein [Campylobacteraceae bacterium]